MRKALYFGGLLGGNVASVLGARRARYRHALMISVLDGKATAREREFGARHLFAGRGAEFRHAEEPLISRT